MLIVIISFADIGDGDLKILNKAFLCFIVCSLFFAAQIRDQPFISKELNSLNFTANLMVMITLFFGIFSSVCQNFELQTLLMTIVVFVNLFFFLSFAKQYICIQYVSNTESPKKNAVLGKLGSHVNKFFRKGRCFTKN